MSVRSFSAWKAQCIVKLLAIKAKYAGNKKIANDVDALMSRLHYLKLEGLAGFLVMVHYASVDAPEFLTLLPTEEEVESWFKGGGE